MITHDQLLDVAKDARAKAYAPYSEFTVGAVVETEKGTFKGANIEVSGRNTSVHAEMMAMFNAVMAGAETFRRIAIACDSEAGPCGLCLHTINEFTDDMTIVVERDGKPYSFLLSEEYNHAYKPQGADHHDHH